MWTFLIGVGLCLVGWAFFLISLGMAFTDRSLGGLIALGIFFSATGVVLNVTGIVLFVRQRRSRIIPGHCPCGYDLTGNESGRCPECGGATV